MKQSTLAGGKKWKTVTPPTGWTWSPLPFKLQLKGKSFRTVWTTDLKAYANITVAKTYWVKMATEGGSDAATGADEAHAFATLAKARGLADTDCVMIKAGTYDPGWNASSKSRNMQVIGYGGPVISQRCAQALSWSLVGNHYEASYATNVGVVADFITPDTNGDGIPLVYQTSSANVDATPGSWFYGSTTIYVRTLDSRQPDANISCYIAAANGRMSASNTLYIEGIEFRGGQAAFLGDITGAGKLYMKNCSFKYGHNAAATDAFSITNNAAGEIILQNCVAARNGGDGFKINATAAEPNLALISCTGRNNGMTNSTNSNGYSRHGPGSTIVINGSYFGNYGPNIKDITTGTLLWCLGVHNTTPASATERYNFAVGDTVAAPVMWLDRCISDGTVTKHLYVGASATAHLRGMTPSSPSVDGGGTVDSY